MAVVPNQPAAAHLAVFKDTMTQVFACTGADLVPAETEEILPIVTRLIPAKQGNIGL